MTLKLVKDGEKVSAPEIIETLEKAIENAKAGKLYGISLVEVFRDEYAEPELTVCGDDSLVTCSIGEEVNRLCKLNLLGLA